MTVLWPNGQRKNNGIKETIFDMDKTRQCLEIFIWIQLGYGLNDG